MSDNKSKNIVQRFNISSSWTTNWKWNDNKNKTNWKRFDISNSWTINWKWNDSELTWKEVDKWKTSCTKRMRTSLVSRPRWMSLCQKCIMSHQGLR